MDEQTGYPIYPLSIWAEVQGTLYPPMLILPHPGAWAPGRRHGQLPGSAARLRLHCGAGSLGRACEVHCLCAPGVCQAAGRGPSMPRLPAHAVLCSALSRLPACRPCGASPPELSSGLPALGMSGLPDYRGLISVQLPTTPTPPLPHAPLADYKPTTLEDDEQDGVIQGDLHDIAVIKLALPVEGADAVALPRRRLPLRDGQQLEASGYGRLHALQAAATARGSACGGCRWHSSRQILVPERFGWVRSMHSSRNTQRCGALHLPAGFARAQVAGWGKTSNSGNESQALL